MHQLSDPQNFVDCGMTLQTSTLSQSQKWELEEFRIERGNEQFGIKSWFEPQQKGGTVILKQKSNLPLTKTHVTDLNIRPVNGFYKECCEADLMEVRALKRAAESGIKPKRIDIRALWAQYGDDIFFALLLGNLRVLSSIREVLESLELKDLEDTDGTE